MSDTPRDVRRDEATGEPIGLDRPPLHDDAEARPEEDVPTDDLTVQGGE